MRIAFAGGGTGGHVFPVQSLIKYINISQPAQHEYFWFGENPSLEFSVYEKLHITIPALRFISIKSGKRRREKGLFSLLKNIGGLFALKYGIRQSLGQLVKNKIDVIFCKGGYVSLPVVFAAYLLKKPIFLHESDTTPGLANRICSKFATTIFTGFENVFPDKEIVVGQILDDDLLPNTFAIQNTFNQKQTHILVTGGSQGAQSLYEPLAKILHDEKLHSACFHIVLGTKNQSLISKFSDFTNVTCYNFVSQQEMGQLLLQCDVAITRGGTTSLAEQHLFGLKKLIVPIPWTHDQLKNAQYYVSHYEDILVRQDTDGYQSTLEKNLMGLISYKKSYSPDGLADSICASKKKIVSIMFS